MFYGYHIPIIIIAATLIALLQIHSRPQTGHHLYSKTRPWFLVRRQRLHQRKALALRLKLLKNPKRRGKSCPHPKRRISGSGRNIVRIWRWLCFCRGRNGGKREHKSVLKDQSRFLGGILSAHLSDLRLFGVSYLHHHPSCHSFLGFLCIPT